MAVKIAEQLNLSLVPSVWKCLRLLMTSSSTKSPHAHTIQDTTQSKLATFHSLTRISWAFSERHSQQSTSMRQLSCSMSSGSTSKQLSVMSQKIQETTSTYGKLEAKHNRKMGHVTLFSDEPDNVVEFGKGIDFLGENSNPRTRESLERLMPMLFKSRSSSRTCPETVSGTMLPNPYRLIC